MILRRYYLCLISMLVILVFISQGQTNSGKVKTYRVYKIPDTGQSTDYTQTSGEDSDYKINLPSYTLKGDGTVIDNITGLMWQQTDGGEMAIEKAITYCDTLSLAGYQDWRLPTSLELFSIQNHDKLNPSLDITYFTKTLAEYWWTSEQRIDDATKIWSTNSGGGIGPHPKTETISAGGSKKFHVRAVRDINSFQTVTTRFVDNGNGTITDQVTGLIWQKIQSPNLLSWEDALKYSEALVLGGSGDWRLPNIKELQSLNDISLSKPAFDKSVFTSMITGKFWSSTTQFNSSTKAWYLDNEYGIVTYELKTALLNVICVRSKTEEKTGAINESLIIGAEFEMGDHHGFVDPSHPSDELPVHKVKVSNFYMSKTETSNKQGCDLLNYALSKNLIEVRSNAVFLIGGSDTLYLLNKYASYYSIGWDGKIFSVVDFRANHPLVGIMWAGAAAMCNWLSAQNGLSECYNLKTWECDFTKNGYRLPTEAEWEFAGRGGQYSPYLIYPTGNTINITGVNLPNSGDPYETSSYPQTTPVGFYDGKLKLKSEYNWPGSAINYQTSDGANAYGLYDMQGNVWEFVNDWYGQNYYSQSTYENPKGPTSGFIMPDGKPYRGMRGGNWYNGLVTNGINDGHSRVANRNPSYYRGPQDPNHPYYHLGFRFARNYSVSTGIKEETSLPDSYKLYQNYPNPFNPSTIISYQLTVKSFVTLKIYDVLGREIKTLVNEFKAQGMHNVELSGNNLPGGVYFCSLSAGAYKSVIKMLLVK